MVRENKETRIKEARDKLKTQFSLLNKKMGGAIKYFDSNKKVIGRSDDVHDLDVIMARLDTPVGCIIAPQGVGKTAVVTAWKDEQQAKNDIYIEVFELKIGLMRRDGEDQLIVRMNNLLQELKDYQDKMQEEIPNSEVVLFIDEVHTVVSVFGSGTKIGGDLLKDTLARAQDFVKVITATTTYEYNNYIASDKAFARRLKELKLEESSPKTTLEILKGWLRENKRDGKSLIDKFPESVLQYIIVSNRQHRLDEHEPAKSIDTLATVEAISYVDNIPITKELVNRAFKSTYGINLEWSVNPQKVYNNILRRVKGQPYALHVLDSVVKRLAFNLDNNNQKPKATIFFAGTTGTGKTETAKALAEAVFGDEKRLITRSMTDYIAEGSDIRFRRMLGQEVAHNQSTVILLDEIEKAHPDVLNVLLPILDEGIIHYHQTGTDNHEVPLTTSLKNTIVIATSNAGAEYFKKNDKVSNTEIEGDIITDEMEERLRDMEIGVLNALSAYQLKPEFLQRFTEIVPFTPLSEKSLVEIARLNIDMLREKLKLNKDISIALPDPVYQGKHGYKFEADEVSMYISMERINKAERDKQGARQIKNVIDKEIFTKILDAYFENNYHDKYRVKTNGKALWSSDGGTSKQGRILVEPV